VIFFLPASAIMLAPFCREPVRRINPCSCRHFLLERNLQITGAARRKREGSNFFQEESMKKLWILPLFCFLISSLFGFQATAQTVGGPEMIMPERSHDFKEVDEGTVLEHSFKVMNQGGQVLEIKNVNPG
jgi:hypothetical protein